MYRVQTIPDSFILCPSHLDWLSLLFSLISDWLLQEMENEYIDLYKRLVVDENKRPIQEYQWEYNTILANQSLTTRPVPAFAEKMSNHWFKKVNKSLIHFRDAIYKYVDEENFEIVLEHPALRDEE